MRNRKRTIRLLLVGGLVGLPSMLILQASPKDDAKTAVTSAAEATQTTFMRRKLATVHKVVEGLATDDFDLIKEGADEMLAIRESAHWDASSDPFYVFYTRDFEKAVKHLKQAADDQSVEAATFAYVHMTYSCTACHQRVRSVKRISQHVSPAFR